MTTPKRPNESGETIVHVRWMVETPKGWLGAWDKEAFEAYLGMQKSSAVDATTSKPVDHAPRAAGPDTAPTPRDVFVQMLQDQVQILKDSLADTECALADRDQRIAALNERLENNYCFDSNGKRIEVKPDSIPDGIECRDETIRMQDERITELTAQLADTEAARDTWRRQYEERDEELGIARRQLEAERKALEAADMQRRNNSDRAARWERVAEAAESRASTMFERTKERFVSALKAKHAEIQLLWSEHGREREESYGLNTAIHIIDALQPEPEQGGKNP